MQEQQNNGLNQHQQEIEKLPKPNKREKVIWAIVIVTLVIGACSFAYLYGESKARQAYYANNDDTAAYPADSVHVDGWASPEDFANWKNATFPIPQYNDIPTPFKRGIVKIFLDNGYHDGNDNSDLYFFTKIKDRAYRVIAYGDFTGQGDLEMAFVLENSDFESSAIFIIPQNGNILYWKKLSNELPTIKSFKKGALIYMNEMKLVPALVDGIIKQTKTFDEYYQYTEDDIKNAEHEEEGDEPEETADTIVVEQ